MSPPRPTITDHVELLCRFVYVCRHATPDGPQGLDALAAPPAVRFPPPADAAALARTLATAAVPPAAEPDGAALLRFADRCLGAWAALGPALGGGGDAAAVLLHPALRDDLPARLAGPAAACPPGHAAVLFHAYQLYARHLTPPDDGREEPDAPPTPPIPDWTSPWAALLALRVLLGGGAGWDAVLPQLRPPVRAGVLRLAATSELVAAGEPGLYRTAVAEKHVPAAAPFRLTARLQDDLAKLQAFGVALVAGTGQMPRPRLFDVAAVARSEVVRFRSLDWPGRGEPFRQALTVELVSCARKLLAATLTPRPGFYNEFLRWARARFVLDRRVHFRLSPVCLPVVAHCQNLLFSLSAEGELAKVAAAAVEETGAAVAAAPLELGDVFLLHRVVDGLRAAFGRALRLPDGPAATWRQVFGKLPGPVADRVLALAARSPLARIAVPDLARELAARNVAWAGLADFLDDPAGEPLREYAAAAVTAAVRDDPDLLGDEVRRVLERCLETKTVGGAVLVGDFLAGLVPAVFAPCQDLVAPGRGRPEKAAEREAVRAFRGWVLDHTPGTGNAPVLAPVPEAFHALLAGFLARKLAFDRDPAAAADPRVRLLNGHWRAVVDRTTRGLGDRPWPARPQRLLRCFWLLLCRFLLDRSDTLPSGLGTGSRRWDDLGTLAAKLVAQLLRARWAYADRTRGRPKQADALATPGADDREEAAEFALIDQLLRQLTQFPGIRLALAARGLYAKRSPAPGQPAKWEPDRDAILKYAAADW